MRKILFLMLIPFLHACEIYEEPSYPVLFMGGGKWTFIDYDIVVISSITSLSVIKSDTVCINSFSAFKETPKGIILKQNYNLTSITRRFIRGVTQWEFDGSNLYCDWIYTPGGMIPSHEPFWVSYPNPFYTEYSVMSVMDIYTGAKTDFTFLTDNIGVAPPNKLVMTSPDVVINLYSSNGARDKAVTFKVILTFMREIYYESHDRIQIVARRNQVAQFRGI